MDVSALVALVARKPLMRGTSDEMCPASFLVQNIAWAVMRCRMYSRRLSSLEHLGLAQPVKSNGCDTDAITCWSAHLM